MWAGVKVRFEKVRFEKVRFEKVRFVGGGESQV